jgi:hypothetical protein
MTDDGQWLLLWIIAALMAWCGTGLAWYRAEREDVAWCVPAGYVVAIATIATACAIVQALEMLR